MNLDKIRLGKVILDRTYRDKEEMAINKETSPMLTTGDVARLLNIHINTVRRWSNEGKLKAYRIGSRGDRRFQRQEIAKFLLRKRKTVS